MLRETADRPAEDSDAILPSLSENIFRSTMVFSFGLVPQSHYAK
jgi:hypothetical protein